MNFGKFRNTGVNEHPKPEHNEHRIPGKCESPIPVHKTFSTITLAGTIQFKNLPVQLNWCEVLTPAESLLRSRIDGSLENSEVPHYASICRLLFVF